jgi:hypothetical protein
VRVTKVGKRTLVWIDSLRSMIEAHAPRALAPRSTK